MNYILKSRICTGVKIPKLNFVEIFGKLKTPQLGVFYLVGAHSIPSHGALRRLRGNRDDLTARVLVKSTCFRTGNRWLRAANRDREPKIKTPHGRFNFWLGRTRGDGGVPPFPFWEIYDFPKWLQNIDNVLRHKYASPFVQSVRIANKKYPCGGVFLFGWGALNSLARRVAPAAGKP